MNGAAALAPLFAAPATGGGNWRQLYGGARPLLVADDCGGALRWRCVRLFRGARAAVAGEVLLRLSGLCPPRLRRRLAGPAIAAVWPAGADVEAVCAAVQLGTPGPYRKAAVLLADRRGLPVALAKVSMGPRADAMIDREVHNLTLVAGLDGLGGAAPRLLDHGRTAAGRRFLVTDVAPAGRAGDRAGALHRRYLTALGRAHQREGGYADAEAARRIASALDGLSPYMPPALARLLHGAAACCRERLSAWQGPLVLAHGDFVPWNLRRARMGLYAFDWEYAWHDATPVYDLLHLLLLPRALSRRPLDAAAMGRAVAAAQAFLRDAYPGRWGVAVTAALALHYLLDVVLFYATAEGRIDTAHPVIADYLRMIEGRSLWMP